MENILEILKKNLDPSIFVIDVKRDVHTNTLKITVDTEDVLTLDKTASISKEISNIQELDELYPEGYQLEVSSPGIGSPLLFPFQYRKNIGRKLALKIEQDGERSTATGNLLEADDSGIKILVKKQELNYSYDSITNAVVKVSFN